MLESKAELYPATWAAFQVLEKAIAEEMPADRPKRKQGYEGKPRRCVWSKAEQIKRLQYQARYIRRTRKAAEADIKDAAQGKEEGKVQWMRVPWLVRVCLAQPLTSCRALARAHSDFIGSGGGRKGVGCSRFAITRIKDAFAEVCKKENAKEIWRTGREDESGGGGFGAACFAEGGGCRRGCCFVEQRTCIRSSCQTRDRLGRVCYVASHPRRSKIAIENLWR
jgi:hypothetical protein